MKTVAQLPLGAVVLPGFDTDQPDHVWEKLNDPRTSEEHPQYRFAQLLSDLGADPSIIRLWPEQSLFHPNAIVLSRLPCAPRQ